MASGSLRRYDVQAKWSLLISLAALAFAIALAAGLYRNYAPDIKVIVFSSESFYRPGVLGVGAVAMLLSALGAVLGINSAGQRRNELQKRSWVGFFLGAACLSLSIILLFAFMSMQMPQKPSG